MLVRNAFPNDYPTVADKAKEWADPIRENDSAYRIMIEHFRNTCFIAEDRGEIIGYLLGFKSQSSPDEAVIYLVHVAPRLRGNGVGRRLFNQYQAAVKALGCRKILALGEPENKSCAAYYQAMGLKATGEHTALWVKEL